MKIASVIVDVPAMQTDRPFDYKIPEKWSGLIVPGMRVIVPFGPRKVQGFILELKDHSEHKRLKSIEELTDLTPSLTPELLELGNWLTEKTLCFKVSAFQAMLPSAMKAKYDKVIKLGAAAEIKDLPEDLQKAFSEKGQLDWKEADQHGFFKQVQKALEKGHLETVYQVAQKGRQKQARYLTGNLTESELLLAIEEMPQKAEKQKAVLECFLPDGKQLLTQQEIKQLTGCSDAVIRTLVKKDMLKETFKEVYRDPYAGRDFIKTEALELTAEQAEAISPVLKTIEENRHEVFLLYGITGSGKTEIYLQSIEEVLKKGKEAIVLVPEISLTPQMVNRFKGRFGSLVAVLHSGLSIGEKYDEWRKIQRKEVKLVVGARSAVFAPFENLGMIIIDEEHESSYKQEENPRYHARDAAIHRAEKHHCPVILGSATPALESFARAQKGVYTLLELKERVNKRALPAVELVDMREELRSGNRSMFSESLFSKLKDRLEKGHQTVLFLNKRGYSSFVMCRDCGYVIGCPHCDISLTYHRKGQQMKCHYCGYEEFAPATCPECSSKHIRFFGTGTQRVEEELTSVLPEARVIRMDVDTTSRKGAHERLLSSFGKGEADILLGTQMIAKGLDFPNVTLVGVLAADTMLHLPDFRAAEKTFQLLTQVSGRAGRHELSGEVVIQTYTPGHYSIEKTKQHDYLEFYDTEMAARKLHSYPPFYYLAVINVSHPEIAKTVSVTEKIVQYLKGTVESGTIILGPVSSPIPRINNRYRYQCMIKYKREKNLPETLKQILERFQQEMQQEDLLISIDMNPQNMM
ncbi:primosomal protein N' [Metabacillus sp. GX 13764]|uniref:primosomal protein N' n=1 Tax=Metabacillus kandeliae TaxID=2900151 RepID=UPI001E5FA035|nr:primosomal protein N' [Metabacillus kandeliae]